MTERSLPVRAVWFLLVGWWVTPAAINVAWFLNATVAGIPLGVKIVNRIPTLLTLAEPRQLMEPGTGWNQHPLSIRAVYFVLVGWWLSWVWANVAALCAITIVGLPATVWLVNRLPYVTSLYRFDD